MNWQETKQKLETLGIENSPDEWQWRTDLSLANLICANLSGAYLSGANLSGADLPVYQKWFVTWQTNGIIKIGCKEKTVAEWDVWFASDETYETERNTADFERIEAAYQHAKRMVEIYQKYEVDNVDNQQ